MGTKRPLWKCPKCSHRFVTRNLSHSCVRVSLRTPFRGRPPARKRTFDRWLKAARACGSVTAYAQKSRVIILESPDDVDGELELLMREAYRVGTQEITAKSVGY